MPSYRPHQDDSSPLAAFTPLRLLVLIFSCLSFLCAICTTLVYICLWRDNSSHARRPTLQFVMVASVAIIIVEILDVVDWALIGNSRYCGISRTFLLFFNAVNASSLSCIGLNLVLLLYAGMATRKKAERFYYPGILVMSLVATSVPIYQACHWYSQKTRLIQYERSCWFYSRHFDGQGESNFFWLWYFCVLFLIILAATILSVLAIWKIFSKHNNGKQQQDKQTLLKDVFYRVGIRCVLYTLVPFFVNVWSFIMQFTEFHRHQSNYPIAYIDAILSCCSGIFVSVIFFSEPTIINFITKKWLNRHPSPSHTDDDLSSTTEEQTLSTGSTQVI
ncbi:hypothetical protein BC941DRAFT_427409 [Chlamydoabsidia padenii]|nr:hypothetical protein BC941DRAFT_427409 [Chlamydoabsidia padenii]